MHDSLVPTRAASLLPHPCASPPASPVPIPPLQKSSLFISPSCRYLLCYEKPGDRENLAVLLRKRCYSFSAPRSRSAGPSGHAHKLCSHKPGCKGTFQGSLLETAVPCSNRSGTQARPQCSSASPPVCCYDFSGVFLLRTRSTKKLWTRIKEKQ